MNQSLTQNRRGLALLIGGALAIILLLSLLFSYTFLTLEGGTSPETTTYITQVGGDYFKEIKVSEGSKRLLVKRATYKIEAVAGDGQTVYERSLKPFSDNRVSIRVQDQKDSRYLGKSGLGCAQSTGQSTVYYSCKPSAQGVVSVDPLTKTPFDELPDDAFSQTLLPYKDGFLRARSSGSELTVTRLDARGTASTGSVTQVSGFGDNISDNQFSVSHSGKYAILSNSKGELLIFKDVSAAQPTTIKLPQKAVDGLEHQQVKVVATDSYIYVVIYGDELHVQEGEEPAEPKAKQQHALTYDLSGQLVKERILPSDWFIRDISNSQEGKVLFLLSDKDTTSAYILEGSDDVEQLRLGVEIPSQTCWKDNESFYYLANTGTSVYQYSVADQASYLVYGGLAEGVLVTGLNCTPNSFSFTLSSDRDGELSSFLHYTLADTPHTGVRPESVMPLYFDSSKDIFKISREGMGARVDILDDNGDGVSNTKEHITGLALERLRSKGVSTDNLNMAFGF